MPPTLPRCPMKGVVGWYFLIPDLTEVFEASP
jgi:hypothetical protein